MKESKVFRVPGLWCLHAYYTLCPESPEGYVLLAGMNLAEGIAEVFLLSPGGEVLDRFGKTRPYASFFHTGLWQSWSADGRYVYYQTGSQMHPVAVRREIRTGREIRLAGDIEGAPAGENMPVSGLLGMLYAAGYGNTFYHPELSPVPFGQRKKHGLFVYDFDAGERRLKLSVQDLLELNSSAKIRRLDDEYQRKMGSGLTLMMYCVRWSRDGKKFMFHFGNHCVDRRRVEPHVLQIFTANSDFSEIHLALDLTERNGLHWSFTPDGKSLIGYGPKRDGKLCVATVGVDGTGYRELFSDSSGGHPSLNPEKPYLLLTDTYEEPGYILLADTRSGKVLQRIEESHAYAQRKPGRNRTHVDLHPVFSRDGKGIWYNRMHGNLAELNYRNLDI